MQNISKNRENIVIVLRIKILCPHVLTQFSLTFLFDDVWRCRAYARVRHTY